MQLKNIQRRHKHLQPIPRLPKLGNAIKQPVINTNRKPQNVMSDIYLVVQLIAAVKLILVFRHQTGEFQLTASMFHLIHTTTHFPSLL